MIHIAICEDCPVQTALIRRLLDKYQTDRPGIEAQIYNFDSGEKLLKSIASGNAFDLLLLDILLPGLDGIELAKEVRKINEDVAIIFMTSSEEYAFKAFSVSAFQYILKPVDENALFPVLDKFFVLLNKEKERFFMLSTSDRTVMIPFSSIICVELFNRALRVYLDNGSSLSSKFIRKPFNSVISPLLQDSRFLYSHKSFVLNMSHVKELTANAFLMANGVKAPVPRYKYADAKAKFHAYVSERESRQCTKSVKTKDCGSRNALF